jgi:hypothetical protein
MSAQHVDSSTVSDIMNNKLLELSELFEFHVNSIITEHFRVGGLNQQGYLL